MEAARQRRPYAPERHFQEPTAGALQCKGPSPAMFHLPSISRLKYATRRTRRSDPGLCYGWGPPSTHRFSSSLGLVFKSSETRFHSGTLSVRHGVCSITRPRPICLQNMNLTHVSIRKLSNDSIIILTFIHAYSCMFMSLDFISLKNRSDLGRNGGKLERRL